MTTEEVHAIADLREWLDNNADGADDAGALAHNCTRWFPALVTLQHDLAAAEYHRDGARATVALVNAAPALLLDALDRAEAERDKIVRESMEWGLQQAEIIASHEAELEQAFREGRTAGRRALNLERIGKAYSTFEQDVAAWRERRGKS